MEPALQPHMTVRGFITQSESHNGIREPEDVGDTVGDPARREPRSAIRQAYRINIMHRTYVAESRQAIHQGVENTNLSLFPPPEKDTASFTFRNHILLGYDSCRNQPAS